MSACAKFPLDLTELSVFRVLKDTLGGVEPAVHFFWLLWRDLAQLAQEGAPLGRLTASGLASFTSLLVDLHKFSDKDLARAFLQTACVEAGLFAKDGEDLVCLRFISLNSDLVRRADRESVGGMVKAFNHKQRKMESELKQLELRVPARVFVDADGTPLDAEAVSRLSRLIISCDNALLRERPPIGWTEGLIQLALRIIRKLSDDQIDYTVRKVVMNRKHPALAGLSTEKLLPQFDTIVSRVE